MTNAGQFVMFVVTKGVGVWISRKRFEELESAVFESYNIEINGTVTDTIKTLKLATKHQVHNAEGDLLKICRELEQKYYTLLGMINSLATATGYEYAPESTEPAKFVKKGKKK